MVNSTVVAEYRPVCFSSQKLKLTSKSGSCKCPSSMTVCNHTFVRVVSLFVQILVKNKVLGQIFHFAIRTFKALTHFCPAFLNACFPFFYFSKVGKYALCDYELNPQLANPTMPFEGLKNLKVWKIDQVIFTPTYGGSFVKLQFLKMTPQSERSSISAVHGPMSMHYTSFWRELNGLSDGAPKNFSNWIS